MCLRLFQEPLENGTELSQMAHLLYAVRNICYLNYKIKRTGFLHMKIKLYEEKGGLGTSFFLK